VLHFAGLLSVETGEDELVRECVAVLASIRTEDDSSYIQHNGDALAGYVEVLDGQRDAGIDRIERALDSLRSGTHLPGQRSTVARILLAARTLVGDARAGLAAADRLLAAGGGVRVWEAEARRLRAEFLAALGAGGDDVEAELDAALQVARRQQARSFELRVAMSLLRHARARRDTASAAQARALLARLVAAISDGTDTRDLREAHDLLAHA
jgi:adenylate cyclase